MVSGLNIVLLGWPFEQWWSQRTVLGLGAAVQHAAVLAGHLLAALFRLHAIGSDFYLAVNHPALQPTWTRLVRLVMWGLAVILSNVITFNLVGRWQFTSGKGFLFFANLLVILVLDSFFYSLGCSNFKRSARGRL